LVSAGISTARSHHPGNYKALIGGSQEFTSIGIFHQQVALTICNGTWPSFFGRVPPQSVGPGLSLQSTLGGGFDKLSQLRQAQPPPGVGFPLLSLTQCSNPGKKNPAAGRIFLPISKWIIYNR
jgi:hypothetical protein